MSLNSQLLDHEASIVGLQLYHHAYKSLYSLYNVSLNRAVLEPQVLPAFAITHFCNHCNIKFDPIPVKVPWKSHENTITGHFSKTLAKRSITLNDFKMTFDPYICWCPMCDSTQGSLCPTPMVIHQSMWIQWLFFKKIITQKDSDPKMTCDPTTVEVTQGSLYPSPIKICQSMWIQRPFFQKNWTKGHWLLDDFWPQVCWGHMCDSTQGLLYPSPMKIIVCGFSDPFLKN